MERARAVRRVVVLLGLMLVAACASGPDRDNLPTSGVYKIGKPYQVKGVWYYPKEDFDYDATGIASWYGPGFHERQTANGEIYDQNEMTAAHKTLPMPSLVRVTNLDNGRAVVVRINDRGPFVAGRIIDMSRRGAQLLGFEQKGTAKVRVQIMADESRAIAAAARRNTPATILASDGGEASPPKAAPRAKIDVENLDRSPQPATRAPQRVAITEEPIADPQIAGSDVDGRFVPAPVVTEVPVRSGRNIFVQAGAFTVPANASRLSAKMAAYGRSQVTTTHVNGRRFYRVRLGPMNDVDQADAVLNRILQSGHTDARIVVD